MNWHEKFFGMVDLVKSWSHDPSTKVGAVIVDEENNVRSVGYNGFPRGVWDDQPERYERPIKYKWTEHAERNAIYAAARHGTPMDGCIIYVGWFPCADCARAIVQCGIKHVNIDGRKYKGNSAADQRWAEDFFVAEHILLEGDVEFTILDIENGEWYERKSTVSEID